MQLLNEHNSIIKTPEVIEYLQQLVLADPVINAVAAEIAVDLQIWGSSGLHFSARHCTSGEPVLLKLNVPSDQLWWTRAFTKYYPELQPRVFASSEQLGEHQLGWVLSERVQHGLHSGWQGREFDLLLEAGVRFQRATRSLTAAAEAAGVLHTLRVETLAVDLERGVNRGAPGPAKQVLERLFEHWGWVNSVCELEVCHGDLHMANALSREGPPGAEVLLIDFHPTWMPWACEPAKPEILNAEPQRPGCRNLIAKQAAIRSRLGLSAPTGAELERLQAIVLGWWAIQMWGYIGSAPDPNWRARNVWHAENRAYISAAAGA